MTSYGTVGGGETPAQNTIWSPNVNPAGGTPKPRNGPTLGGANQWGAGVSQFGADNNLLSSQINPTDSAGTTRATNAATNAQSALAGFQFSAYAPVAGPNYGTAQGYLSGANNQMQAAQLNYGQGNAARAQAGQQLTAAQQAASPYLQNAGGIGLQGYTGGAGSGGAAARADTGTLNRELDTANSYVGPQFGDAADTQRARALTAQSLEKASTGSDRNAIAAESLALLEARSQPGYEQALRASNQKNAAMGRRGSAQVGSDLADITTSRERELALARRDLANEASAQTLQDRINLTQLGMGVTQGFGSEDRAGVNTRLGQSSQLASNANSKFAGESLNAQLQDSAYGRAEQAAGRQAAGTQAYVNAQRGVAGDLFGMGQAGSQLSERNAGAYDTQENNRVGLIGDQATFQRGVGNDFAGMADRTYGANAEQYARQRADEYGQQGVLASNADQLSGYMNNERTYDANNRNELRTERGYQTQRSDQAVQDEIQRAQLEDQLRNSDFDRSYRTAALGFGAPSPGTVYGQAADRYQQQANAYGNAAGNSAQLVGYGTRRTGAGSGNATLTYP